MVVIGRVSPWAARWTAVDRRTETHGDVVPHRNRDLPPTRQADIIVAAVGVPHMLTADMVRPGAAVVDVGSAGSTETHRRRGAGCVGGSPDRFHATLAASVADRASC